MIKQKRKYTPIEDELNSKKDNLKPQVHKDKLNSTKNDFIGLSSTLNKVNNKNNN